MQQESEAEKDPVRGDNSPLRPPPPPLLPGLCAADGAVLLAQGSQLPPHQALLCCACGLLLHTALLCSQGCSLCAGPLWPPGKKKTCMISYMKDICNWTAGPIQHIYNSKQNMLKPLPLYLRRSYFFRKCICTYHKTHNTKNHHNTDYPTFICMLDITCGC